MIFTDNKPRVLEVFDSLEISGGVQKVVMNVLRNIDRNKVQIDFAVYDAPKVDSYEEEAKALGTKIYKIDNISTLGVFKFYKQIKKLLLENTYDIVHAHNLFHNGIILLAAKRAGVKVRISHSHQSFDDRNNKFPRNIYCKLFKLLNKDAATKLVACSDLAADFLFGKNKEYTLIPNAVNMDNFRFSKSKLEIKKSFGITDDSLKILVHVGRFTELKNQFFLLDIMDKLRDENCVLLIAGQGELRDKFLNAVNERNLQDKIKYLGLIRNVPELLYVSDCLLVPSIYEGLPVVGVEAQAAGCRAIISGSLTKQVDLGLNLIDYLSIDSVEPWVIRLKEIINEQKKEVPFEKIMERFVATHFENDSNISIWCDLYGISQ
ncbi:MAG: glycosyltransferase [Clostridia bacterium]|nr:glycosyltransferase [Clostridia bacterium]